MPDVITYSALISACEKAQDPWRTSQVLNGMPQQGLMPNILTYKALFSACETGALPPEARQLFEATLHQGIRRTWSPATRYSAPVHRLHDLQLRGLLPDAVTYSAAISPCEKGPKQP